MKNIEDLYILSPVQQSLLNETQVAQAVYTLRGPLDSSRIKQRWEQALARHPALRTAFHWKNLEKPVQVIQQNVSLPFAEHDASDVAEFIEADRRRGFDLNRAPLLRLSLLRHADDLHQLVWTYHRLILDETSANMIVAEVFGSNGREPSGSFRDYISWLRQQDPARAGSFWTDMMRACEGPTLLASTPLTTTTKHERQVLELPCALHKTSLLIGAWALLLCRYNDVDEAVFGLKMSGRPTAVAGVDSIAGPFSHVLPARITVPTNERVDAWLKSIDDWYLEAEQYQHVSHEYAFESVVSIAPELQNSDLDHFDGLYHPLLVTLRPDSLSIRYDPARFQSAFIGDLIERLQRVIEILSTQPEQRVGDVSLLTPAEQQQLTTQPDRPLHVEECAHSLFELRAASAPGATALVFAGQELSYEELNARANQLAHHLRSLGLRPETNVGVCMYRSIDSVVALLAILKAGGVYIPLDPQLPAERLSYILEETNVSILLTQQDLLFDLPPIVAAAEVICLDQDWYTIAQHRADNPEISIAPAQIAYIIYTSGSTGRPKGVCVPHAAVASHLRAIQKTFELNEKDRMLQFASLSFDVSIEQILAPLSAGATVVLRSGEVWNIEELWEQVVQQKLTVLNLPPAYWNQLTRELDHPALASAVEMLRLMIVGGDAMPVDGVRRWQRSLLGKVRLLNAYGPTETVITSSVFDVPRDFFGDDATFRRVPIGFRVGKRRLYVLDRDQQPVVTAGRGELFIAGAELARGYFNDPALTADRFLPDPFSAEPGARMYSSGDIVRRLPGGELEYEGRRDGQVKVRGFRIELGDVESALGAEAEVQECAVALKERDGEKRLVAYVVLRPDAQIDGWELRARLKERLPEHMIPAAVIALDSLPLTTSGKIDRRALPDFEPSRPEQETAFAEPRDETEEKLVQIWTELLGLARIGVHDNFFEAGGDSLLATQLIARVNKSFQVSTPLRALFDQPTIAELARNVEIARAGGEESTASIQPGLRIEPLPLSYAQERLWFVDQLQKDSPFFNVATAVHLRGQLQFEPLERTFSEIVKRHETLRTVFTLVDGAPAQVVCDPQAISIPVCDLSQLPGDEQQTEVSRLIHEETRRPFDLTRLFLLRVSLLRLSEEHHILMLTMHHIVSDGWSIGVMVREVAELYEAFCAGRPSPLPELPIQYADFASWQRRWLQGSVLETQLDYWRRELSGKLPDSPLAGDRVRPAVSSFAGVTRTFEISKSLAEQLKEVSRREETTIFMTLMAAFQTLLHRQSGHEDIIVGTDVANRNRTELEGLIGFFVNLLPIRTRPSPNLTFREYLHAVKDVTLRAYEHQDLPFDRIVTELQPERSSNRTPIFQTLFVMQNAPVPATKLAGLDLSQMDIDEGVAKFDLAVFMEETDRGLIGKWNYSTDIFEANTIERLASQFARLLESIVNDPEARLHELEIRSETETAEATTKLQQQQDLKLSLLKKARRQSVRPVESVIKTGYLPGCDRLPLVIEPALAEVELVEWAAQNRELIETELLKHGALLFRNFNVSSVAVFERFAAAICDELFSEYGDLPREQMSRNVYGSTPYPSNQAILFHNESSHLDRWPMKIWFYCLKAAHTGGETPIVDCRRVYELLSPSIRDRFAEQGICYVRNFTEGLDVRWSDFFHTTDREQLQKECDERRIAWKWRNERELQTSKTRPAVARHPKTDEMVFFNQLQLHHVSCLEPSVRESLLSTVGEERLPRNVYYRDGSRIEEDVMAEVDAVYRQAQVSFPWQEGDIMMLDNMLVAHGRNPFAGERKIVVALGEMCNESALHKKSKSNDIS